MIDPEGLEPAIPPTSVPIARPISLRPGETAVLPDAALSKARRPGRLRALLELLALIPLGFFASLALEVVLRGVHVSDERWLNVAASLALGSMLTLSSFVMVILDGQRMSSIGWTGTDVRLNALTGLLTFILSYVTFIGIAVLITSLHPELLDAPPTAQRAIEDTFPRMALGPMVLMMGFVAVWEEVVFRGFLLTRLQVILRRWWLTIPAGGLLFAVPHVYQGWLAVLLIFVLALIMGTLFVWRRSLVPSIVYHFAHNMVMLFILRAVSERWQ